jgi:oligoendopeptidase F
VGEHFSGDNRMTKQTGAEKIRWDLSDLFASLEDPKLQKALDTTSKKAAAFSKQYKGKLATLSADELKSAYVELEALMVPLYKVNQYVSLLKSVDTSDDDIKRVSAMVSDVTSKIQNDILFFELEVGALPKDKSKKLQKDAALANYAYNLSQSSKTAKYNLSEKEEQVINLKDLTGSDAFQKLYSELVSSFEFEFEVDGKKEKMNGDQLRALRMHEDPNIRRNAMKLFYSEYEKNSIVITHIFNNVIKDFNVERKLRGYKSAISIRNTENDLDDKAVECLHNVTRKSYPLVQRYYKLKKKILNLDTLTLADIYAPMPQANKTYSWAEAKQIVLDSFKDFDQEFYDYAKLMFDDNRIDAPVGKTKRGGAFCSGSTPDVKPYVLLNYMGKPRDIMTLAHELGHAIHDMYASKQTLFNYFPILPLAETASVFSEMIVTDKLLKEESNKNERQALLTEKLEDIFATSHRQNMFSSFEHVVHKKISDAILSTDELKALYKKELEAMFGNSVTYTPEYEWEWSTIPHIFEWPFYVYSYNFGNLLVMALYEQYKENPDTFPDKLKEVLTCGGAKSPKDILKIVKADITKEAFWEKSLKYIETLLDELEATL